MNYVLVVLVRSTKIVVENDRKIRMSERYDKIKSGSEISVVFIN